MTNEQKMLEKMIAQLEDMINTYGDPTKRTFDYPVAVQSWLNANIRLRILISKNCLKGHDESI